MKELASVNAYSVFPYYYTPEGLYHGETVAAIVQKMGKFELDGCGINGYLNKSPFIDKTCFDGVYKLSPNSVLVEVNGRLEVRKRKKILKQQLSLFDLLSNAIEQAILSSNNCVLALSGGLDSAIILAFAKEVLSKDIPVYTLATGMEGYCELEITKRTADYFGVELNVIKATEKDFVDILPETIAASEVPLYNLHPVSKMIFARKLSEKGFDCIITGDAADQTFAKAPSENYLPIVGSIMRSEKMKYLSPFWYDHVVAYGREVSDESKTALRSLAKQYLPTFLLEQKKTPKFAPPIDISCYWDSKVISNISSSLNIEIDIANDHSKTLWTTLGLLVQTMNEKIGCVA